VGLAAPLHAPPDYHGSTYCFLPMPMETGQSAHAQLPFDIHGFFDLNSTRGMIKLESSPWNAALLRGPLVNALLQLLIAAKEKVALLHDAADAKRAHPH